MFSFQLSIIIFAQGNNGRTWTNQQEMLYGLLDKLPFSLKLSSGQAQYANDIIVKSIKKDGMTLDSVRQMLLETMKRAKFPVKLMKMMEEADA